MLPSGTIVAGCIDTESNKWTLFEWDDPSTGKGARGEVVVLQNYTTSGDFATGFWRLFSSSPGAEPDGSHDFVFPTTAGDDITWVLEGSATITVVPTHEKYVVTPGSIFSTPQGLPLRIQTSSPAFKTAWLSWQGSHSADQPPTSLLVNHVHDDPIQWSTHATDTPEGRRLPMDRFYPMWTSGTSGHLTSYLGRSDGSSESRTIRYINEKTDETIYLIEGTVQVVEEASGVVHKFQRGNTIGLRKGVSITWVSEDRTTVVSIKTSDN